MWALLKLASWPIGGAELIFATAVPSAQSIGAYVAIAVVIGAACAVGYYKAAAEKGERLLKLASEENELVTRRADRLERENVRLAAQPNLEQHARLLQALTSLVQLHHDQTQQTGEEFLGVLRELRGDTTAIRQAVVPPR